MVFEVQVRLVLMLLLQLHHHLRHLNNVIHTSGNQYHLEIQVVELLQPEQVILLLQLLLKDFQVVLVIICVDHIIQVEEVVVQLK